MRNIKIIIVPLVAFCLVLGLDILRVSRDVETRRAEATSQLDVVCSVKARELSQAIGRLLRAAETMGGWSRLSPVTQDSFNAAAMNTLKAFPEVEGVGLAPDGVLTFLFPPGNYELAFGKKILDDPGRRFASGESLRNREGIVLGPVLVESGARDFIGQVPVYRDGDGDGVFWGFATAIGQVDSILERTGFKTLDQDGFLYRIEKPGVASDQTVLVAGTDMPMPGAVTKSIQLPGLRMMLSMAFARPLPTLSDHAADLAGGVALALVLAGMAGALVARPARSKETARSRTQRLLGMSARLVGEVKRSRNLKAELTSARDLLKDMFELSPAAKLLIDPMELVIVEANPAARRFLGRSDEDLKGEPLSAFMDVGRNGFGRKLALGMRGQAEPMMARLTLPGGEPRDVEISCGPVRSGGTALLLAVLQDVSGRESARKELLASQGRLESIFEALDCAIVEVDGEGFIRFANPGFTQMFGHGREGVDGMPYLVVCPQDDGGPCGDLHASLMEGRVEKVCTRKRFVRRDGREFWGSACVSAVKGRDGVISGCVAAITDVSDIVEAKRQAEEANRAKNRFLANVSHEIRSPMNAIMGLAELALRNGTDSAQRGNMEKILEAGGALVKVMEAILDYASLESGKLTLAKTTFDPGDVLGAIEKRFTGDARAKGLSFDMDVAGDLPRGLVGDPVRLEQALAALVSNAVKFTDKGGVRLSVGAQPRAGGFVPVRFSVSDTGQGMDPARLPVLEQPFVQGESGMDRSAKGAGLGLSIASKLLALMGTSLKAESSPGKGTTMSFTVSFPSASAQEETIPASALEELFAGLAGKKVLVVDDNPLGLHTAREMLKLGRIDSDPARSGQEALARLEADEYDAVLLDIQMPGMDGFETFRRMREAAKGNLPPVIAVTGHAREEDRLLCFEAGMDNHLSKPYSPDALFGTLRQYLVAGKRARKDARILDSEGALALLMGNKELYQRLLAGFVREYSGMADDLRRMAQAGDMAGAATLAHTIKGLASNLGGDRLRQVCLDLEQGCLGNGGGRLRELIDSFENELSAFIREASRLRPGDATDS